MTREDAIEFIDTHLLTSLSKLPHGYVIYAETAKILVNKIYDDMEVQLLSNTLQLNCAGCKYEAKTKWDVFYHCNECARYMSDGYEAKESE